jgi:hypothetical protein
LLLLFAVAVSAAATPSTLGADRRHSTSAADRQARLSQSITIDASRRQPEPAANRQNKRASATNPIWYHQFKYFGCKNAPPIGARDKPAAGDHFSSSSS